MVDFKQGELARSLAGHDKDSVYVIIEAQKDSVSLCDGRIRTLDRPKIKNVKHIQIIHRQLDGEITDENIRHFLESYGG